MSLPVGQPYEFLKSDLYQTNSNHSGKPPHPIIFESHTSLDRSGLPKSNRASQKRTVKQILAKVNSLTKNAKGRGSHPSLFKGSTSNSQSNSSCHLPELQLESVVNAGSVRKTTKRASAREKRVRIEKDDFASSRQKSSENLNLSRLSSSGHSRTKSNASNKSFIGALEILRTQSKVADEFSSEFMFEMDKIMPDFSAIRSVSEKNSVDG